MECSEALGLTAEELWPIMRGRSIYVHTCKYLWSFSLDLDEINAPPSPVVDLVREGVPIHMGSFQLRDRLYFFGGEKVKGVDDKWIEDLLCEQVPEGCSQIDELLTAFNKRTYVFDPPPQPSPPSGGDQISPLIQPNHDILPMCGPKFRPVVVVTAAKVYAITLSPPFSYELPKPHFEVFNLLGSQSWSELPEPPFPKGTYQTSPFNLIGGVWMGGPNIYVLNSDNKEFVYNFKTETWAPSSMFTVLEYGSKKCIFPVSSTLVDGLGMDGILVGCFWDGVLAYKLSCGKMRYQPLDLGETRIAGCDTFVYTLRVMPARVVDLGDGNMVYISCAPCFADNTMKYHFVLFKISTEPPRDGSSVLSFVPEGINLADYPDMDGLVSVTILGNIIRSVPMEDNDSDFILNAFVL